MSLPADWTRRRAIRIVAAGAGLPLMIAAVRASAPPARMFHWQGEVLDAVSELTLWHTDAALCRRVIRKIEADRTHPSPEGIAQFAAVFTRGVADYVAYGCPPHARGFYGSAFRPPTA